MFDGPLLHPYSIVNAQLRLTALTPEERKVLDEQLLFYPGLKIPDPQSDLPVTQSGT